MNVTLEGITQHGKNRVTQHGCDWTVVQIRDHLQATRCGPGPFADVESTQTGARRWVSLNADPDFKVKVQDGSDC